MYISKYFTLEEMLASQQAVRKRIDNSPTEEHLKNIINTCKQADKVRELLRAQMLVSSGYRSAKLNAAIGGSRTSSHLKGQAIDFTCPVYGSPIVLFTFLKDSLKGRGIAYDQLILEFPESPTPWVHIGFGPEMRGEKLVFDGSYRVA